MHHVVIFCVVEAKWSDGSLQCSMMNLYVIVVQVCVDYEYTSVKEKGSNASVDMRDVICVIARRIQGKSNIRPLLFAWWNLHNTFVHRECRWWVWPLRLSDYCSTLTCTRLLVKEALVSHWSVLLLTMQVWLLLLGLVYLWKMSRLKSGEVLDLVLVKYVEVWRHIDDFFWCRPVNLSWSVHAHEGSLILSEVLKSGGIDPCEMSRSGNSSSGSINSKKWLDMKSDGSYLLPAFLKSDGPLYGFMWVWERAILNLGDDQSNDSISKQMSLIYLVITKGSDKPHLSFAVSPAFLIGLKNNACVPAV